MKSKIKLRDAIGMIVIGLGLYVVHFGWKISGDYGKTEAAKIVMDIVDGNK